MRPPRSFPALALLAALSLLPAPGTSSAQELDFQGIAPELIEDARGGPRAAGRIGSWNSAGTPRWIDDSTFVGPYGLRVDRSCLALEGKTYPQVPARFIETVQALHDGVQNCASRRVLPATVGLIYDRMPGVTIKCDARACADNAYACAPHGNGDIFIKVPEYYRAPGTYFHELMHKTKAVDNQVVEHHNDAFHTSLRDEVYFWQGHCFKQEELIGKLRKSLGKELKARNLSLSSVEDAAAIYPLAFDACAVPLRYNERKGRVEFNAREVEAVCKQYQDYLMMEVNMRRALTANLTPLILACSPARDKIQCPGPELSDSGSEAGRELFLVEILAPPRSDSYSPEALAEWTQGVCPEADRRDLEDSPSFIIQQCAKTQALRLARPEVAQGLREAGVEERDLQSLKAYFALVEAKARAVSDGPGLYLEFPEKETGEAALKRRVPRVLARCADPAVKDSALCAELQPDSSTMRLMARLLMHWEPETLPR